jgi:predicted AlkP superfamily phosphohydrolase/phosphomutase
VGGVAINLSGRQPNGRVTPADYGAVRDEIIRQLQAWRDPDTGQPVVQNVWRREELYHGPFVERSPDIVFMVAPAYHQGWGVSGSAIVPAPELQPDGWSGVHAMEGILIVQGPSIRRGALVEGATLVDIGPTLLHSMGQAIPSHMEGRVLLDIFTAECRRKKIEYSADEDLVALEGTRSLSAEENEAMISRLQALGYVE